MSTFHSALYRGALVHTRRDHLAHRTFRYPVYTASLDLTELPALDRELRLFSHRGRNLFSFDERDYEGDTRADDDCASRANDRRLAARIDDSARAARTNDGNRAAGGPRTAPRARNIDELLVSIDRLRAANGLPVPAATRLVTNLRVAGYVFNPVSFFLDYDATGALTSVIAEVNNTYGGRLRYVLGPQHRIANARGRVGFRHARELFVSPFLHGPRDYELWFDAPLDGERLAITMHVDTRPGARPEAASQVDRVFVATLTGERHALSDRALLAAAVRYPLMSLQVTALIHLEAMKLRLAGVPYRRPGADHRPLDE